MIINSSPFLISILCISISLLIVLSACDNSFDPTDETTDGYSVHGTLDLLSENSYIRIRNLKAPFTAEATEKLDAIVTLRNLDSGSSTTLNSSVRKVEGVFFHTFIYSENVLPDTRYLLHIESSEGVHTELETLTPTLPVPIIERENDGCYTLTSLTFQPINGGTITLRFGIGLEEDDPWGRPAVLKSDENSDLVSFSFFPLIKAQEAVGYFGECSSLLRSGNLYVIVEHYSPGFYETLNSKLTDILKTTQQFGGFYADTLAISVDTSQ